MGDRKMQEQVKHVTDIAAGGTAIGTLAGYLPPIAALFTIVWLSIQIYSHGRKEGWWGK